MRLNALLIDIQAWDAKANCLMRQKVNFEGCSPKLRPTMQCHVGPCFLSNSFLMNPAISFSTVNFSRACSGDQKDGQRQLTKADKTHGADSTMNRIAYNLYITRFSFRSANGFFGQSGALLC